MISKIQLQGIATYRDHVEINLSKINYFFGGNGVGKSTIAKYLNNEIDATTCSKECDGEEYKVLTFNKKFIEDNFQRDKYLPGIFTLGSESIELKESIEKRKKDLDVINDTITKNKNEIQDLIEKKKNITLKTAEDCWKIKVKYDIVFEKVIQGARSSKNRFFEQCRDNQKWLQEKHHYSEDELVKYYKNCFTKGLEKVDCYNNLDENLLKNVNDKVYILEEEIIGANNSTFGKFIDYLKASDWIREGEKYAKRSQGKCPYCQQSISENIIEEINNYFNAEYQNKSTIVTQLCSDYRSLINNIDTIVDSIKDNPYDFLNYEEFDDEVEKIKSVLNINIKNITEKITNLASKIYLSEYDKLCTELQNLIEQFNKEIREYNKTIDNQQVEQEKCKNDVWRFIASLSEEYIKEYNKKIIPLEKEMYRLEKYIEDLNNKRSKCIADLEKDEKSITSIAPVIQEINRILEVYGFTNFKIENNTEQKGTYKICRKNGEDAKDTLSEGEYNFIVFLYFYKLCFGSHNADSVLDNKIIVIDDPVSSLDSNMLFAISNLITVIACICCKKTGGIKQLFVLSHNIFFYNELAQYWKSKTKNNQSKDNIKYFVVSKKDNCSYIEAYSSNPIRTTYDLLWKTIREPSKSDGIHVFNAMRRILEYYFNLVGGLNYTKSINSFEGDEKVICKSLLSYVNAGSHNAFDDLFVSFNDDTIQKYMGVFKTVFEKMNQIEHYNMMMKIKE